MWAEHLLLGLAVLALGAAGWRVAGRASPVVLERGVAAAVLAAAAAVVEALALGLAGLAGSALALATAAGLTWAAAHRLVPATSGPPLGLDRRGAIAAGAALGALAATVAWMLRYPYLGFDSVHYHLTEVAIWIADGNTGSTPMVGVDFPTGSYPLTNEVLLAWAMGLAHDFTPVPVLAAAQLVLLVAAGWLGLRRLGVAALPAGLALAAVATLPDVGGNFNTAKNDLGALAWLVAAGGLCAAAPRRPALLAVAVVAAGLAVGTKTTVAPQCLLVLAAGGYACRASLRRLARPLAAAAGLAVVVGGVWYLRNMLDHGSPLWPLAPGPFGDPAPPLLAKLNAAFLDDPGFTLRGRTGLYAKALAGGLLLAPAGVLAWALTRTRPVVLASAACAASLLAWARAPYTGRVQDPILALNAVTTTRYLFPALATAALAIALASRGNGAGRTAARLASVLLAAAVALNLVRWVSLGWPYLPGAGTPLAGALLGAAAAAVVAPLAARHRRPGRVASAVGATTILAALALTLGAGGYVARHARTDFSNAVGVIGRLQALPAFAGGDDDVSFAPETLGPLAGDELEHRLRFIPHQEPCARVLRRRGWVVTSHHAFQDRLTPHRAPDCLRTHRRPVLVAGEFRVYRN